MYKFKINDKEIFILKNFKDVDFFEMNRRKLYLFIYLKVDKSYGVMPNA